MTQSPATQDPATAAVAETATEPAAEPAAEAAAEPAGEPAGPTDGYLTSGAYALELIQRQTRRLGRLQPDVLADRDPEPLHQLRVSLRRLRTALRQFAPALELPEGVSDARIAGVARRTGLTRDLDVLRQRLEEQIVPLLPEAERTALTPTIKRLARERRRAFEDLVEALNGPRYLKLLARLHKWQRKPRYTELGRRPLRPWLYEWQAPISASLFLHGGWFAVDPRAVELHDLRKRIKGVRYALEHLEPFVDPAIGAWIAELKEAQDNLGDLHDLQVLEQTLADLRLPLAAEAMPALRGEIQRQQEERWLRWQGQAERLRDDASRRSIHRHLLDLSAAALEPASTGGPIWTARVAPESGPSPHPCPSSSTC